MQTQQNLELLMRLAGIETFLIAVAKTVPEAAVRADLLTAMQTLPCVLLNSPVPDDHHQAFEATLAAHLARLSDAAWPSAPAAQATGHG